MQNQERVEMRIWLQVVPREEALQYWQERLRLVEASSSENSDRSQQILRRAVCHVMLGLHYLLMQNLSDAKTIQQKFMNLLGRNAIKDLWSYITCSDSEKYSERLNKYLANFNFNEEKSVLYFVTVVFIANEGQMALRDPKRCGSWAWFWLVESAQRLGKICLQSKEIGPEMTACVRFSIGSLLLNCASVKDVYAHKYLLKSFSHFQAAIERRMRKGLTRRIDAEIVLNEQSMVAIVNMATCFLELRQMDKCTALICQARLLLGKSTILDELSKHYLILLRFWSDNWRSARCLMNNSRKLSNELRGAFEASAAWFHLGAVLDSSLAEVCVDLNELLPIILYKSAVKDLTKPAYSQYNAAVLKLRRASRVLELLEPLHPLTGDCYALLAVMYYNMMQLEDQEEKALNCLRACLKIQRNLIANGCATSCWAWRSIDVARKLAVYFATSDRQSEWSGIVTAADAILEMSRDCSVETRSLLLGDDAIWTELRLGDRFVAERLVDPIIDWEGKQHLRETCEAMFGRVYPEDNLPTYTEIMCYSHYLMKLWNAHENVCDSEWIYLCVPKCRMTRTSNNIPRRNDFLNGLNEYTLAAPRDKQKILRRLQINHEQLLQMCEPAQLIDASYGRDTEC
uniref:Cohesin loading complex subunit SCC4 homolog n=1 Tax=Macrostomum lignano TaxID=282301 RepID=A0A1I8G597_9PLAT